jgi:hypothetical protein
VIMENYINVIKLQEKRVKYGNRKLWQKQSHPCLKKQNRWQKQIHPRLNKQNQWLYKKKELCMHKQKKSKKEVMKHNKPGKNHKASFEFKQLA